MKKAQRAGRWAFWLATGLAACAPRSSQSPGSSSPPALSHTNPTAVDLAARPVATAPPPELETPAGVQQGPTLSLTGAVADGTIRFGTQRIRFPLAVTTPHAVTITLVGRGRFLPRAVVLDDRGRRRGSIISRSATRTPPPLRLNLEPGSYVVEVSGPGRTTGSFRLRID